MTVRYTLRADDIGTHTWKISATLDARSGLVATLPAWMPGSYVIRDFAGSIVSLAAHAGQHPIGVDQVDKATWRIPPVEADVTVEWTLCAVSDTVHGCTLDSQGGCINGVAAFLSFAGHQGEPCEIDIEAPDPQWSLCTGLQRAPGTPLHGFGRYTARNWDELADCPILMGPLDIIPFSAGGVPHEFAICGRSDNLDRERLARDLATICTAEIAFWEPESQKPPFAHYHFLAQLGPRTGGLEHRNSVSIGFADTDLPWLGLEDPDEGYTRLLELCSHEYFHAWCVKRIRPAAFVPFDLARESYTSLMWVFEGFTSYYDELFLRRTGLISPQAWLKLMASQIDRVFSNSGWRCQTLAQASLEAWTKLYKSNPSSADFTASYYPRGAIAAMVLDLEIRAKTSGRKSLDDVMRHLWTLFKEAGSDYAGLGEDDMPEAILDATGVNATDLVESLVHEAAPVDWQERLKAFGVLASRGKESLLGIRLPAAGAARVLRSKAGSPAALAGIAAGDEIIAVNGMRVDATTLAGRISRHRSGQKVTIALFRRDELREVAVELSSQPGPVELSLGRRSERRSRWIGC